MYSLLLIISVICVCAYPSNAQRLKVACTEKERKNHDGPDPIMVNTCLVRNFKFISNIVSRFTGA